MADSRNRKTPRTLDVVPHETRTGALALAVTALLLFFARFVLTDLDNPFEGTWNVSAEAFADLANRTR